MDTDELIQALTNLESRVAALEARAAKTAERTRLELPAAKYLEQSYNPERDAFPVSYWDMRLMQMIETVNDRLRMAVETN